MKQNILSIAALLVIFSIFACQKEQGEVLNQVGSYSTFVSIDQAENEVLDLLSVIDANTKAGVRRRIIERFSVGGDINSTKTELDSVKIEPLVYVFNFEDNQGFAIASGDNRTPPVFCITDSGRLSDTTRINDGALAMLSAIDTDYRISSGLPITNYDGNTLTLEQYSRIITNENNSDNSGQSGIYTYYTYGKWKRSSPIGSILNTKWGQLSPFNKYCKTSQGEDAYVGCVAIAVGQLMSYWGKNTEYGGIYYDWGVMDEIRGYYDPPYSTNSVAWNMVQHFLGDIGSKQNLNMTYGKIDGSDGSGANCENINRTLVNFGYSSGGSWKSYNEALLRANLLHGPVIGCGYAHKKVTKVLGLTIMTYYSGGHEWIYDQYIEENRERYTHRVSDGQIVDTNVEKRILVHCNWGWGGSWDGYYLSRKFDTNNGSGLISTKSEEMSSDKDYFYRYKLGIHTDIRP